MTKATPKDKKENLIKHIIGVSSAGTDLFLLLTIYDEANALGAVGQLLHLRDGVPDLDCVLNTNQPLNNIWISPQGNLWIGSSSGYVWTTSSARLPDYAGSDVTSLTPTPLLRWKVSKLPDMQGLGYPPNVTAAWGTGEEDVYLGTFKGRIYHWNGMNWSQFVLPGEACINEFSGSAGDDVWLAGYDASIAHFDGASWSRIALPPEVPNADVITGIRSTGRGQAIACTNGGRFLSGGSSGFQVTGPMDAEFYGIGMLKGNVYLAGGRTGIWQVSESGFTQVKPKLQTVGVFETADLGLFFIEAEQPKPCVIQHRIGVEKPWVRRKF